jgi:hypothetical protein
MRLAVQFVCLQPNIKILNCTLGFVQVRGDELTNFHRLLYNTGQQIISDILKNYILIIAVYYAYLSFF